MALEIYAVETKTGLIIAQIPGAPTGPLARESSGFSSATFNIPLDDPAMPSGWESMLEAHRCSILAVDDRDGTRTAVWCGMINKINHTNSGLSAQTVSTEWLMDSRRATDRTWGATTELMQIVRDLHQQFEADGAGVGLLIDAPNNGTKRAWSVKRSDAKSYAKCFEELGLEWSVDLALSGNTVLRTLRARLFDPAAAPTPAVVIQVPAHTSSWSWTASRLEAESATVVYVEGDGTGDTKTVSTPVVDAVREAAGYPRTEAWESVSGVTNAAEADRLAAQFAAQRFLDHEAVELTALNGAGGVQLSSLKVGDAVRVVIDTPALQKTAVYRLASWEVDASGASWTPTLAPARFSLYGWRRPTAKSASLAVREAAKSKNSDPIGGGYISPIKNAKGDRLTLDPFKGTGWTDEAGVFRPMDGSSGGGSENPWENPEWGEGDGWEGPAAETVVARNGRFLSETMTGLNGGGIDGKGILYTFAAKTSAQPENASATLDRPIFSETPACSSSVSAYSTSQGVVTKVGEYAPPVISAALMNSILGNSGIWLTLTLNGTTTGKVSARPLFESLRFMDKHAYGAVGMNVRHLNGSTVLKTVIHYELLRWPILSDGGFGAAERVLGADGGGVKASKDLLCSVDMVGGRARLRGLSDRGQELHVELPPVGLSLAQQSVGMSRAWITTTADGSGKRLYLGTGHHIALDEKLAPTAPSWTQDYFSDTFGRYGFMAKGRRFHTLIRDQSGKGSASMSVYASDGSATATPLVVDTWAAITGGTSVLPFHLETHKGWVYVASSVGITSFEIA